MSYSSVIERLELYLRFLPVYYDRARTFQNSIEKSQPIAPFEFDPTKSPFPDIPPLAEKDWIHYIQSPIMEWEVYWETAYKSINLMHFISGYNPISTAKTIYNANVQFFKSYDDARQVLAHFSNRLPSIKDYTNGKIISGFGYSKESWSFRGSKWSTSESDHIKLLSICSAFISAAELDFSNWVKANIQSSSE